MWAAAFLAWFRADRLFADLWIPAFAGMTGRERKERWDLPLAIFSLGFGRLSCSLTCGFPPSRESRDGKWEMGVAACDSRSVPDFWVVLADFWIPAFAGMTGRENGRRGLPLAIFSLGSGLLGCSRGLVDSRFRGNDGAGNGRWGLPIFSLGFGRLGCPCGLVDSRFRGNDGVKRDGICRLRFSRSVSGG